MAKNEKELEQWEINLDTREKELNEKETKVLEKQTDLITQAQNLNEKELQAKNGFPELVEKKYQEVKNRLKEREGICSTEEKKIEDTKEYIRKRENEITKAEIKRDTGFSDERKKLDDELAGKRNVFEQEIALLRTKRFSELEENIAKERSFKLKNLESELLEKRNSFEKEQKRELSEIAEKKQKIINQQAELDEQSNEIEYQKKQHQIRKQQFEQRKENIENDIKEGVKEREKSFEQETFHLKDECERLRDSLQQSDEILGVFKELKRKIGDDPEKVLLNLKTQEEALKNLRQELSERPTKEMQLAFDSIKSEKNNLDEACERLSTENRELKENFRNQMELEREIEELIEQKKSLTRRFESVDADNNRLNEELKRLQASYEREEDREARIKDIEAPYINTALSRSSEKIKELDWLEKINRSCTEYGLKFPRRILHAFHTALKTSEWSPITVLAGVSGTGKSELPRLYSHFGGINFLSLSVQPNWDSQESMLGFFNSIDNKFDSQPVLRFLAQSQKEKTEDYPFGLKDTVNLILMDEMNLAHVELYFAEFLSKLELRRGKTKSNVPCLEVKLGAGVPHYDLPLGRNILWAGTMNQDETTKSLSDKVLDRGIVINFPRPTSLERRKALKPLKNPESLLSMKLWEDWVCLKSNFSDKQIKPYKSFVEDMNGFLAKVGRALGHRVWQSIEYYMANYPDVIAAQQANDDDLLEKSMKIAFEDQLVQKVMPKLRGIETRGKSKTECLDKIRAQLVVADYSIVEDFDLACEFGYGQFIWNSANYLKEDENTNIETDQDIPKALIKYAKEKNREKG